MNEGTKLDIYNSKRKNAADDKMVSPGITDRFKNDVAFDKGDYGDVQKKFAPGPTYEGEYDRGIAKMKDALKRREAEDEFRKKYKEPKQPKKGLLKKIFGEEMDLLKSVIAEAQSFEPKHTEHTEDSITDCAVCGKGNHVPAKHFGKALAGENNQPVKEATNLKAVTKKTQTDLYKQFPWTAPKNRAASPVRPGNPKGVKVVKEACPDCGKAHADNVPCSKKSLLFGDELKENQAKCVKCHTPFKYTPKNDKDLRNTCTSCNKKLATGHGHQRILKYEPEPVEESMKFSRQHDTPEQAEKHRAALEKQGVKAWVNHAPDGKHHTFWMQENENSQSIDEVKKWDKIAHVAAIARKIVGPVKKTQVITPKKDKKPKYKVDYMKEDGEETLHARAARLHDFAAEHSKGENRVIERPYKDAVHASYSTKHSGIASYIRNNGGDHVPYGGRTAFHKHLAQMHRDADKE